MQDEVTYIKLFRKLLDNELLQKNNLAYVLFTKLLLLCNYKTGSKEVKRSYAAKLCNVDQNKAYRTMKFLEKNNFITLKTTKFTTIVTIVNWEKYQQNIEKNSKKIEQQIDSKETASREKIDSVLYPLNYSKSDSMKSKIEQQIDSKETANTRIKNKEVYILDKSNIVENNENVKYGEDDIRLTNLLFDLIKTNHPHVTRNPKKSDFETMNKLYRLDKKDYHSIEVVIRWTQQNDFWSGNILSVVKLRKHFDQLSIQIGRDYRNKQSNGVFKL